MCDISARLGLAIYFASLKPRGCWNWGWGACQVQKLLCAGDAVGLPYLRPQNLFRAGAGTAGDIVENKWNTWGISGGKVLRRGK